jgi:hypothetical protein
MSSHIYIILLSKLAKRDRNEERSTVCVKEEGRQVTHEDKMQLGCLSRERNRRYVPYLEIKPHPKNAQQSFHNALTNPKNDIPNNFELSTV